MLTKTAQEAWVEFLSLVEKRCSKSEFENWFSLIRLCEDAGDEICLEVPNIFVQSYLLDNYGKDLELFIPKRADGSLALSFVMRQEKPQPQPQPEKKEEIEEPQAAPYLLKLNPQYTFDHFIEGPANQFVKSAAIGVAAHPAKSFNPLFIHGGVGLGKTHLLHAIAHYVRKHNKKLRIHLITTEEFINDLVDNLRNKSMDKMKRFYRSLDLLLVDDIPFLESRLNFEEELCNTFESLINQNKQIVITSDKPPSHLKLSERMVARMEWGLVANVGVPDLETRVAILQHKAEQRGFQLPQKILFFIAERIFNNVRQLEGALNRLSAFTRMMGLDITEDLVEKSLSELFQNNPSKRVAIENVLKSVATLFGVRVSDLCGKSRTKEIALPRQVAMYLAKELINESLVKLASYFGGKTHSTLLHACKKVAERLGKDETLRRQIQMAKRNLEH
jgi:chromosomal replication initiator protein